MSVVPFIGDGPNRTVTSTPEEFATGGDLMLVCPLLNDLNAENACFDLHVGKLYRVHKGKDITWNTDTTPNIMIRPRALVSIQTLETVSLPISRFGYVLSKVDLLERGLTNAASKVDPGYSGHLLVTVFNLGPSTITLKPGQPFCTLVVHRVEPGATSYKKGARSWHGVDHTLGLGVRLRDWADRNSGLLSMISPLVAALAAATPLVIHKVTYGTWLSR